MYKKFPLLVLVIIMVMGKVARAQQATVYPKVTGFFGISQPLVTLVNGSVTSNFGDVYAVAFPCGINLLKSDKFGFSFEISPTIRTEKNMAKVSSVTFHPGALFRYPHGFTLIARLAFETSGRFGFTPTFNKVIYKGKDCSFYASVPVPVRFGNAQPWSAATGLILGVGF